LDIFLAGFFALFIPFFFSQFHCVVFPIPTRLIGTKEGKKHGLSDTLSSTLGLNWASPGCNDGGEGLKRRAAVGTRKSIRYVTCVSTQFLSEKIKKKKEDRGLLSCSQQRGLQMGVECKVRQEVLRIQLARFKNLAAGEPLQRYRALSGIAL
jgi:hypothetical protein